MKPLFCACLLISFTVCFSQSSKIKATKYPSLLWEIRGRGLAKPSYLFGTMHVSSKMVFNLSDSFYIGIRSAQVVALETNPGTWQENFSRYDMDGESLRMFGRLRNGTDATPQDFLTVNSLKLSSYEKLMEAVLYSNPSILNNFLYRSRSGGAADFEEDTYLDLHIFQTGKKLGKKLCGVEDFDGSMQLVKEAYTDAAHEKTKKEKSYDYDEDFSYRNMEAAYRSGNLDLLDTINKVNSQSVAFDEKFLYKRNEIQAHSIDSILRKGQALFVGVGAAHLPGERGVIEMLRRAGYSLRPIPMKERDGRNKEEIEKIRVPVQFSKQTSNDGFFSVNVPGKFYRFGPSGGPVDMQQYADMTNGSYYMVSRLFTNAAILGQSTAQVERKVDSVLYENIPGKMISKKAIVKNGYRGFDIVNRTRRGDYQRYNIFIAPFEIIIFKMSGTGDYVRLGTEAEQFFSSIQLKEPLSSEWKKFRPAFGGFEVELPHEPAIFSAGDFRWTAYDAASKTAFEIVRTDVHNHSFVEADSFDLELMEESFASSEFVQRILKRKPTIVGGYPALDLTYKFKDSSVAAVRFLIAGPHYYTLLAKTAGESKTAQQFVQSFSVKPFVYGDSKTERDTALFFAVKTHVPLEKKKKISMYPDTDLYGGNDADSEDSLTDDGNYASKVVSSDSTGEKISVSFYKPSAYSYSPAEDKDSLDKEWIVRKKKTDTLSDKTIVVNAELGGKGSSRMLKIKSIEKEGVVYELQTELDTLSAPSTFVKSFYESFTPFADLKGVDTKTKKTELFFSQFFSKDSLQHKRAVKNIGNVVMDSTDFVQLKKCVQSLGWKEKRYLEVKKDFIGKFAYMPTKEAANFLRNLYTAAGDTVELQYAVLETLLQQSTAYSCKIFAGILETDPPVLSSTSASYKSSFMRRRNRIAFDTFSSEADLAENDGSFFNNLSDSLQLTAGIYKSILPLINLDDYKEPVMALTASLLDSNMIAAKDYGIYLPKLLIEAKQLLKRQVIEEKTKAIEKAQASESDKVEYNRYERTGNNNGNSRLSLYASLLVPFWNESEGVSQLLTRLLASNDRRLKYNTALLFLRNKKPLPDTLLNYFAAADEFRYELYKDLKKLKQLSLFPAKYRTQEALGRSQLLYEQPYNKPDTVVFLEKLPLTFLERRGYVYVFKYKEKEANNSWKLATVGLLPTDENNYFFDDAIASKEERSYDFTSLSSTKLTTDGTVDEQAQKLLKKMLLTKHKSGAQFYGNDGRFGDEDYRRFRD